MFFIFIFGYQILDLKKKCPSNGDIIKCLDGERSFPENFEFLKTKYPTSKWENCSVRVFRTKIFRLKKKIKDLKKNKNAEGLSDLLSQEFEFPVPNIELPVFDDNNKTQKLNYLVNKTKDVVFENRQLKRELVDEQDQLNNLNFENLIPEIQTKSWNVEIRELKIRQLNWIIRMKC